MHVEFPVVLELFVEALVVQVAHAHIGVILDVDFVSVADVDALLVEVLVDHLEAEGGVLVGEVDEAEVVLVEMRLQLGVEAQVEVFSGALVSELNFLAVLD